MKSIKFCTVCVYFFRTENHICIVWSWSILFYSYKLIFKKKSKTENPKSLTLFFKVIYCFYIVLLYFLKFIFLLCTICVLEHAIRGNVFLRFIFLNRYMEYFFFFPSYISFGLYLILYSYSIVIRS